jgi:hypothetical protein
MRKISSLPDQEKLFITSGMTPTFKKKDPGIILGPFLVSVPGHRDLFF